MEMVEDDGDTALYYGTSGLGAWTGVTQAFLGGNGSGTCYDAGAYQGLRFSIKGKVTSSDSLNNRVIVSLVTAETQAKTYGGDLDGQGGHFHAIVSLTEDWQTVELRFDQLSSPTWGDSLGLPSLATGKLQAIDWGVTNAASSSDIYIDDIELF